LFDVPLDSPLIESEIMRVDVQQMFCRAVSYQFHINNHCHLGTK